MNVQRTLHWFFCFLFFVFCLSACHTNNEENDSGKETARPQVTIVQPVIQTLMDYLQLNASTKFQKSGVIRTNSTGYITYLKWKVGERISEGAVFCTITTKEQSALKQISERDTSLRRFQKPISVITQATGVITDINYLQGDFVNEGDVLADVVEPSSLVLIVNIPYEYHSDIGVGKSCEIVLPDGKQITGKIDDALPSVDSASQTQSYLIRLPALQLPQGMNIIVRIPRQYSKDALCLPKDAVQSDETMQHFWVMKLINDSMIVKVAVQPGIESDSLKEIKSSGLTVNDKIILKGAYGLQDSSVVSIIK